MAVSMMMQARRWWWWVHERAGQWREAISFKRLRGYHAEDYWKDRHSRFGLDLRGVGDKGISLEANTAAYDDAGEIFLHTCAREGIDWQNASVLDVGCGNGFYAERVLGSGAAEYLGVDITDTLFGELSSRFPTAIFRKQDVGQQPLEGEFDVIYMIDVTQHIVSERRFKFAMQNLLDHLADGGVIVMTSWLSDGYRRRGFYEAERPMAAYRKCFPDCVISEPVPFRDKFMFTIRRK